MKDWDTIRATIDPAVWLGTQQIPPQPAAPASSRAPILSWLIPALFTVATLAVLAFVIAYGWRLAGERPAARTVPAALDASLHNIPQAIAGGATWRVIWWDNGAAQVETFDNRPDAARRWAMVRYLSGYAVLCAPGEACQAQSVTAANAVTRKGK